MQYAPARRALAGSVLVLGSVGTVSAVHLDSAQVPSGPDGRSAAAMAPPAPPEIASPASGSPTPGAPAVSGPSRSHRNATRRSSTAADRPVTGRDLVDMARGPRGTGSVVVRVHDLDRTVPLRSTLGIGRRDVLGAGLRSLDDMLEFDGALTGGGGRHSAARTSYRGLDRFDGDRHDRNRPVFAGSDYDDGYDAAGDFDRADGYRRAAQSGAGYRQADLSWDSDDVSYSRPRCGRHRA